MHIQVDDRFRAFRQEPRPTGCPRQLVWLQLYPTSSRRKPNKFEVFSLHPCLFAEQVARSSLKMLATRRRLIINRSGCAERFVPWRGSTFPLWILAIDDRYSILTLSRHVVHATSVQPASILSGSSGAVCSSSCAFHFSRVVLGTLRTNSHHGHIQSQACKTYSDFLCPQRNTRTASNWRRRKSWQHRPQRVDRASQCASKPRD